MYGNRNVVANPEFYAARCHSLRNMCGCPRRTESFERNTERSSFGPKRLLQQRDEFFNCKSGLANDGAERSAIEFFMIGNRCLRGWGPAHHYDVTAALSVNFEPNLGEGFYTISARNDGQLTHAATSTNST
jgi:hypothetical protein